MAYLAWLPAQLTRTIRGSCHHWEIIMSTVHHQPLCPAIFKGRALGRASEDIINTENSMNHAPLELCHWEESWSVSQFDVDRAASVAPGCVEEETM